MAEISKLNLTGSDLDIKDSVARGKLTVVDPNAGEGLITFGVDANGNYGYKKVGADTVTPFKNTTSLKTSLNSITDLNTAISISSTYKQRDLPNTGITISPIYKPNLKANDYIIICVMHNNTNIQFVINDDASLTSLIGNLPVEGPTDCYLFILKVLKPITPITSISMTKNNNSTPSYFYSKSSATNPSCQLMYILS